MNEKAPYPSDEQEFLGPTTERPPEDSNEMYLRAIEISEEQKKAQDHTDDEKWKNLEIELEIKMRALKDQEEAEKNSNKKESTGFKVPVAVRKGVLVGLTTLFGLLPHKSHGHEKMNTDKEGTKKEAIKSVEDTRDLTEQEKADWGAYVTYTKENHFDTDPRMNTRVFAHKVLEDYIKSLNGRPTTVNQAQVLRIQKEFAKLREWTLKKIKNHEKVNGHYIELEDGVTEEQFMANLSKFDDIAGHQTLRYFGADYVQMLKEVNVHLNDLTGKGKGIDAQYIAEVQKMPLVAGEFVSMKETKDEK
jgi:hypothetical protein